MRPWTPRSARTRSCSNSSEPPRGRARDGSRYLPWRGARAGPHPPGMPTRRASWARGAALAGRVSPDRTRVRDSPERRAGRDGAHMRVLGVDPGLTRCGLGVVEGAPGKPPGLVAAGVARTAPTADIGARLLALEVEIDSWLVEHHPDAVAVERVFSQHNVRTVMGTAQAGAVAMLCAARRGLPVALHTPSEVKAAVTGSGRADKAQVTTMVTKVLRLPATPRPADVADALALAICHLWRAPAQARVRAALTEALTDARVARVARVSRAAEVARVAEVANVAEAQAEGARPAEVAP